MGTEACPPPYSSSSLSPPPGVGVLEGCVPTIWLSGKGLGLSWLSITALGGFGLLGDHGHCGQL